MQQVLGSLAIKITQLTGLWNDYCEHFGGDTTKWLTTQLLEPAESLKAKQLWSKCN